MVVDCMSRRSWPQKLKSKDECLAKFMLLVAWFYEDKYPLKTAFVRTDAEQVYNSKKWEEFCNEYNISHERSSPYTKGQNGVAEKRIGDIGRGAKTSMHMSSAPDREYEWALELANLYKQYADVGQQGWHFTDGSMGRRR
jgi:hypothetical protein